MATAYVQDCLLRADSPIYYATREVGRLYETGDHIHNFALTYALGFAQVPYHITRLQPTYQQDLAAVTAQGIYVTPATPRHVTHMISTIKFGSECWREPERNTNKNYPNYGRIKEIAPGSEFTFCVVSTMPVTLPRWIRLGIWLGKCEVIMQTEGTVTERQKSDIYPNALNPLDLESPAANYDIVPMPPNSLIRNVRYAGHWLVGDHVRIPANMAYLRGYHAN